MQHTSCTTFMICVLAQGCGASAGAGGYASRYICVTFHGCERSVVAFFSSIKGESGIYCIC